MHAPSLLLVLATFAAGAGLRAQANGLAEPLVFVVADGDRAQAIDDFLRGAGLRLRHVGTAACKPEALRLADVVVVDWPDGAAFGATWPLGELDRWDRPTVFVGGCGERFARAWDLPGPAEIVAMAPGALGPAMQRLPPPDGATTTVARQGHLFHFVCATAPGEFAAAERTWFVDVVRDAARFATDRPILRRTVPVGAPLPPAELMRRERIDAVSTKLACDPRMFQSLERLVGSLDATDRELATELLTDLTVDGPGPDTTPHNWRNWLVARRGALVWDELSQVWRLDQLAYWRGLPSSGLRNEARADAGEREAEAVALAAKVVQHYGARAFEDLATFSCWQGDVCCLWDRRAGWFRVENHSVSTNTRTTRWEVAVLDTAADRDAIQGGGPPPRPTVSARGTFRNLVARVFLPTLLLDPGTSLRLVHDADADGEKVLAVHLAQRGFDLRTEYRLMVRDDGEIFSVEEWSGGGGKKRGTWRLLESTQCGPLLLPTSWRYESSRTPREYTITDPVWNPDLPAGVESATEQLTRPRER
jgi:hypothetical protein